MFKNITIATIALQAFLANAADFTACLDYFPNRVVPKIETVRPEQKLRDLCFESFAIMHSGQSKTPLYSVEKINRARIQDARDEKRSDRFYPEARLPIAERAQLEDYKGSTYDRGHMAPAGDMPTPNAMAQSFSLANMVPQAPDNNQVTWRNAVERSVRQYAMRAAGDLFVFTGPVFKNGPANAIGLGKVWVPTHLYKLVYDQKEQKAFAYWIENKNDARMNAPISYQELVQRVGIEFLPGVILKEETDRKINQSETTNSHESTGNSVAPTCYTGPRGGTYTINENGKKNYGGC
ncbi:DNA/RNA non-specific endonuclease [Simplicispira metamorpha]|uniref:Endonuclease n=1 Tax=Simplicispira metamorpha TaxID=80881 RepID=A0A4R2NEP5_9BURK|nr:DNA/RNA non-specific endonuclease [Simplicispira metamorpha]TCP19690.1 endonuclease G [Simplicispira metamorpha]